MNQTAPSLTFRVRDGLVVHRERIVTEQRGRQTVRRPERQSFGQAFGSELVELLPGEVRRYAHALEPASIEVDAATGKPTPASVERHKAAADALAELHHKPAARAEALPTYEQQLVAGTVTAVIEALRAAGVLPAAKK